MRHVSQMPIRFLLTIAALMLPAPLLAQNTDATLEGHWAFRIDEATIFVFMLDEQDEGGWNASWTRPESITSNGVVFHKMSGQQTVFPIETAERREAVQLTFAGPQADGRRDILQFRLTGENQALLNYQGIDGAPYPLIRVRPDTPLGPFDAVRIYDRDDAVTMAEYVSEPASPEEDTSLAEDAAAEELFAEGAFDTDGEQDAEGDESENGMPRMGADFLDGL